MLYVNVNTGNIWRLEEIKEQYKLFEHETALSFDDVMDDFNAVDMLTISSYMDDDVREYVHRYFAPCTEELFLVAYCVKDPDFSDLLKSEFYISVENIVLSEDDEKALEEWKKEEEKR